MSGYYKCNDVINRLQEIANDYEDAGDKDAFYVVDYCLDRIMELRPAADVMERKTGKWINHKDEHRCSCCGEVVTGDWFYEDDAYSYCPNCGARMW